MTLLRSTAFNVFFFASTFVLALWGVVLRWSARARIPGLVRYWARLELDAARAICGIRFAVTGREHIPAGAALVASQHQSTFDTLVWFHLLPGCCCVAKRELTRIPLFGALIRPGGLIVVDRSGGAAALRALVRDARRVLSECRPIVIFPEGRRAEPGHPLPIQPGIAALAASTGAPVVPVLTNSGVFWGRRAFRKRAGVIRIAIQPALSPDLGRTTLTRTLHTLFADGPPVDNLVESADFCLGIRPSRLAEPID